MAEAIAVNLRDMMLLDTPIIVIVNGEGGSGGALGIAVGDRVLMQEYAIYSVIPPEGCAAILWRDPAKKVEAAAALKITAPDLLKAGIIDEIVPEPIGGAHTDPAAAAAADRSRARAGARRGERARSRERGWRSGTTSSGTWGGWGLISWMRALEHQRTKRYHGGHGEALLWTTEGTEFIRLDTRRLGDGFPDVSAAR